MLHALDAQALSGPESLERDDFHTGAFQSYLLPPVAKTPVRKRGWSSRVDYGTPSAKRAKTEPADTPLVKKEPIDDQVKVKLEPLPVQPIDEDAVAAVIEHDTGVKRFGGHLRCIDCKTFTVREVNGMETCTDCGLIQAVQVLHQGYVNQETTCDTASMDKYNKAELTRVALRQSRAEIKSSRAELERAELFGIASSAQLKEADREIAAAEAEHDHKRVVHWVDVRLGTLNPDKTIKQVMDHVGLPNPAITKRALELFVSFVTNRDTTPMDADDESAAVAVVVKEEPIVVKLEAKEEPKAKKKREAKQKKKPAKHHPGHMVQDSNRLVIAAVCVCRAAMENGLGLRWWDVMPFVHTSKTYNRWRRELCRVLKLPDITREMQLKAFISTCANRVVFSNKKYNVTSAERSQMHLLGKWLGQTRLNRIESTGAHNKRKLVCMPLFLKMLELQSENVPPAAQFFSSESQNRDECIHVSSMGVTIVYLVLSLRKRPRGVPGATVSVTEANLADMTGVQTQVIMACKKAVQDLIEAAYTSARNGPALE